MLIEYTVDRRCRGWPTCVSDSANSEGRFPSVQLHYQLVSKCIAAMKYPVKYKGFDIQIDVTQPFIGSGVQATYVCSRGSNVIFSGTVAGSFPTNEDAERAACKAAQRRIESKAIDPRHRV